MVNWCQGRYVFGQQDVDEDRLVERDQIHTVFFATESSVDQSKSAGIYVHKLLDLPSRCRVLELKQACYSATAAIQIAMPLLMQNPDQKVLVIASDIARYGLETPGESSQGCGAVAMVISANPRLLAIESGAGYHTEDAMDFWRPNYKTEALVEGKHSSLLYLRSLEHTWKQYQKLSSRNHHDHAAFVYHIPIPKLVEKAHKHLAKINDIKLTADEIAEQTRAVLQYSRVVGNCYTAAMYIGLLSLLENSSDDFTNKRIGFYSYGSGCVAEFFSGVIQPGYQALLDRKTHQQNIDNRKPLSYEEYEEFYSFSYPQDGSELQLPKYSDSYFRLAAIAEHKRQYESNIPR